jgi:hypothetical protein
VLPLSSEKPIEVTGWPTQVEALAVTVNGEPTDALAAGLATVIPELLLEALGPDEPEEDEPDEDEPDEVELAGCAAVAVEDLPPQPTLRIVGTASRETAIDKCLNSFNGNSFEKIGLLVPGSLWRRADGRPGGLLPPPRQFLARACASIAKAEKSRCVPHAGVQVGRVKFCSDIDSQCFAHSLFPSKTQKFFRA